MSLPADRLDRVRAHRRILMRLGFLALVATSVTACIFDQADYKGGGRLDKGATGKPVEPPVEDAATPVPTTTSDTDADVPD